MVRDFLAHFFCHSFCDGTVKAIRVYHKSESQEEEKYIYVLVFHQKYLALLGREETWESRSQVTCPMMDRDLAIQREGNVPQAGKTALPECAKVPLYPPMVDTMVEPQRKQKWVISPWQLEKPSDHITMRMLHSLIFQLVQEVHKAAG